MISNATQAMEMFGHREDCPAWFTYPRPHVVAELCTCGKNDSLKQTLAKLRAAMEAERQQTERCVCGRMFAIIGDRRVCTGGCHQ